MRVPTLLPFGEGRVSGEVIDMSTRSIRRGSGHGTPALPGFHGHTTLSDSRVRDVEAAILAHNGSPPITRITLPTEERTLTSGVLLKMAR
jgi:hypothetical protein